MMNKLKRIIFALLLVVVTFVCVACDDKPSGSKKGGSDEEKILEAIEKDRTVGSVLDSVEEGLVNWNYTTKEDAKRAREEYRRILEKNSDSESFSNVDKSFIVSSIDIADSDATVIILTHGTVTTDSNIGYAQIDESTFIRVHGVDISTARKNNSFEEFSRMYYEAWCEAVKNDRLYFDGGIKYTLKKSGSKWEIVNFEHIG